MYMLKIIRDELKIYFDNIKQCVYNINIRRNVLMMTISDQIKVLCVRQSISLAELARRLGKSPQSFNSKMRRESFTINELNQIAEVTGCLFERYFVLEDGEKV